MQRASYRFTAILAVAAATMIGFGLPAEAATARRSAAVPAGTRAMWLWSRADPDATVAWAVGHSVKEIFAYVPTGPITGGDLARLRRLKSRADASGVRLSALGGAPGWTFDHGTALAWQRSMQATGLFAMIHIDVEPYLLATWATDRAGVVQAFLGLLDGLHAQASRPLEADVPFWYATVAVGSGNLADAVLARTDAVTVMTYRDTASGANSIVDVGADMLARAAAAHRPVRLAAETQASPGCPYCTFFEEGQARMTTTLASVDAVAGGYSTYAGIAIHHYDSWRRLAR